MCAENIFVDELSIQRVFLVRRMIINMSLEVLGFNLYKN